MFPQCVDLSAGNGAALRSGSVCILRTGFSLFIVMLCLFHSWMAGVSVFPFSARRADGE